MPPEADSTAPREPGRFHASRGIVFIACFFVLLFSPLALHIATLGHSAVVFATREAHPRPGVPRSFAEAVKLPAALDLWLQDRHGLRRELVTLNGYIRWHLLGDPASPRILPGRNGRLFMTHHDDAAANSLILDICGATDVTRQVDTALAALRTVNAVARADGLRPAFLIIPSAARLYPEDLPEPFDRQCAGHAPPVDGLAERMAQVPGIVFRYPLASMLAMKPELEVAPRINLHWAGEVPQRIISAFATQTLGLPAAVPLVSKEIAQRTDFSYINPGMNNTFPSRIPDQDAMGWRVCVQQHCGPIEGVSNSAARPLLRYLREGPGARIVVIGDSFSEWSTEMFIPYAREIWHIRTNILRHQAPADRDALMAAVRTRFQGEHVVFLFHDFGALMTVPQLPEMLWPGRPTAR